MKSEQFQTLLFERISAEDYFTDSPAISVVKQVNRDIRKTIQAALVSVGVVVAVGLPDCTRTDSRSNNEFEFLCDIEICENPTKNETEKTAFKCLDEARGNLEGKKLDDVLSPLRVQFAGFSKEQDGISFFRLTLKAKVHIDPTPDA